MSHAAVGYLDAARMRRAWQAGASELLAEIGLLNRINVFPVADGDTGTNMGLTVRGVSEACRNSAADVLPALLEVMSEGALDNARGNSGALLAQFITGFAGAVSVDRLGSGELLLAMQAGALAARSAMDAPREGTLVTLFDALAQSLQRAVDAGETDLAVLLALMLSDGEKALAATTEQLAELRSAGVVDAGAQGMVLLLRGMQRFLASGDMAEVDANAVTDASEELTVEVGDQRHRFCTECRLLGEQLDPAQLRQAVAQLDASSVVVAGHAGKLRVHAHLNSPRELFDLCQRYGRVDAEKAEDMFNQWSTVRHPGMQVAVLTDSGADLPEGMLQDWPVQVVPVHVMLDNTDHLDKVGLTPEALFTSLREGNVEARTSQPAPGEFLRSYRWLADHFPCIVSLHVSSRLSGTWQAAKDAAGRLDQAATVVPVDTGTVAAAQGLIVRRAAELAAQGASLEALLEEVEQARHSTRVWALVDDISYGVRGGRVSPRVGKLLRWLNASPILSEVHGAIKPRGVIFGEHKLMRRFAAYVARRLDPARRWQLLVSHADAEAQALELVHHLRELVPGIVGCYCGPTGAAIGVHAGPGTVMVAAQEAGEYDDD
jgi:hypothetical protein